MEALLPALAGVLTASAVCSLAATPLVIRFAWSLGAVSRPDGSRRLHGRATPLWGGLAVSLGMVVGSGVAWTFQQETFSSLLLPLGLSTAILCLLGLWDDRWPLPARVKLPGQIAATLPIILFGLYPERVILFGAPFEFGWFGAFCTVGWLLLGINALNLIDGMDGLASVVGIVISAAVAVIAAMRGNPQVMLLSLALAGGLMGFLVYNLPPAKVFLGDSGSMVIGLVVSFLSLRVSLRDPTTANAPLLALLLFVPLLDTGLAILRRILKRQNVFCGDRGHLHHQLLDRGLGVWRTLALLSGFCLLATAAACSAVASGRELLAWAGVITCTALLIYGRVVGREETSLLWDLFTGAGRKRAASSTADSPLPDLAHTLPLFSSSAPAKAAEEECEPAGVAHTEQWAA